MNYMGIADTAATGNYVTTDCPITDKHPTSNGIDVTLPNGVNITSSHMALLRLPCTLPIGALKADIFPGLKSGSIVSIGQLCDHGCTATFTATQVQIFHQGCLLLTGHRSIDTNNLWLLQLDGILANQDQVLIPARNQGPITTKTNEPTIGTANSMGANTTIADRIAFYHAAAFSPVISTWCDAIDNGQFTTWPELTSAQVRKHLPHGSGPMIKGHLHQQRSNLRFTKSKCSSQPRGTTGPGLCPRQFGWIATRLVWRSSEGENHRGATGPGWQCSYGKPCKWTTVVNDDFAPAPHGRRRQPP
jgi:hypothetical protein